MAFTYKNTCPRCGNGFAGLQCTSPTCYEERRRQEESLKIQKQQAEDLRRFNQESLAAQRTANNSRRTPQTIHHNYPDQPRTASSPIELPSIGHQKIRGIVGIVGAVVGLVLFGFHGWEAAPHLWGRLFLMVAAGFAAGGFVGYVLGALLEYALPWILGGAAIVAAIAAIIFLWGEDPPDSKKLKIPDDSHALEQVSNKPIPNEASTEMFIEADKQLNILYRAAMERRSPEDKVKLRTAQIEWLKTMERAAIQNPEKATTIKFQMTVERNQELENLK